MHIDIFIYEQTEAVEKHFNIPFFPSDVVQATMTGPRLAYFTSVVQYNLALHFSFNSTVHFTNGAQEIIEQKGP